MIFMVLSRILLSTLFDRKLINLKCLMRNYVLNVYEYYVFYMILLFNITLMTKKYEYALLGKI